MKSSLFFIPFTYLLIKLINTLNTLLGMMIPNNEKQGRSSQVSEFLPPVGDLGDEGLLDPVCPDFSRYPACRLARPRAEMDQLYREPLGELQLREDEKGLAIGSICEDCDRKRDVERCVLLDDKGMALRRRNQALRLVLEDLEHCFVKIGHQ